MNNGMIRLKQKNSLAVLLYIAILTLVVACGSGPSPADNSIDRLKAEKSKFQDSIRMIEAQIMALDTSDNVVYPKVTLFETTPLNFEHYFSVQGHLESEQNVLLIPEVGGIVKSLNVKEGELVKKGQIIAPLMHRWSLQTSRNSRSRSNWPAIISISKNHCLTKELVRNSI